jgi:hypothetical protein
MVAAVSTGAIDAGWLASFHQDRRIERWGNDQENPGATFNWNNLFTVRARKTPDIQAFMCRMAEVRHRDGVR